MELKKVILRCFSVQLLIMAAMILFTTSVNGQNKCVLKNSGLQVTIDKHQKLDDLESFLKKYKLDDLDAKEYYKPSLADSLKANGWSIITLTENEIVIFKSLMAVENITEPQNIILFSNKNNSLLDFEKLAAETTLGYNRFVRKPDFATSNNNVTFFLRGYPNASHVVLSGTFNEWNTENYKMTKTEGGWKMTLTLMPGKYWYKFIIDDEWKHDEDNLNKEPNEFDGYNSVYYSCNHTFRLNNFSNAREVTLTGSFVNWNKNKLQLKKTATGWELPVYLANGTYTYKFLVDGTWLPDPLNPKKVSDENGGYNSLLTIGNPYLFRLTGYVNAKKVVLSGNFNGWNENQLLMKKTSDGWEIEYALKPGNYEYKFIVDGNWVTDPANPQKIRNNRDSYNSIVSIKPNHTFRLNNYASAKQVSVSGDFNGWNPEGYVMYRDKDGWSLPVYLLPGKQRYKFIVDGKWILDPGNKLWENNEYGTGNSVIWIEKK